VQHRVADQVREHLLEAIAIPDPGQRRAAQLDARGRMQRAQLVDDAVEREREIHRRGLDREPARAGPRQVEDLLHHPRHPPRARGDAGDHAHHHRIARAALLQEPGGHLDRADRVAQVVPEDGEEALLKLALHPQLVDVGVHPEPADDLAAVIAQRADPGEEPAKLAPRAAEGKLHLERLAGAERVPPARDHFGKHLRVVDLLPAPALHLRERAPGIGEPLAVVEVDVPVRERHPRERGEMLHQLEPLRIPGLRQQCARIFLHVWPPSSMTKEHADPLASTAKPSVLSSAIWTRNGDRERGVRNLAERQCRSVKLI
jgi:hypothetical protein